MIHKEAAELFETARSPENGKPLENNTRLFKRGEAYAVRLHTTDVVTINPDGTYTLNSGGWRTSTTKHRINKYSPTHVYQSNGIWYVGHGEAKARLFEDGMGVDFSGCPNTSYIPGSVQNLERAKRKVDRLVREYLKGFRSAISEGDVPSPGPGDCWFCLIFDQGSPMGSPDHLLSHFEEKYYVPSLLWNAMQRRGNPELCWHMAMRGSPEIAIDDLRSYLGKRKLAMAEELLRKEEG